MGFLAKIFRTPARPPLDLSHPQAIALRKELRALQAMPLSTKAEIKAWYEAAGQLEAVLYVQYRDIYESLPHEIHHYLVDADIRAKDAGYAKYQEDLLADLLSEPKPSDAQPPA
ncbi:MAG: hypothetical protein JSS11_01570 [Verrucomicrobia bacterium]|nr:hypothetical protein [Verrucomicrobiota bacterium]